MGPLSGTRVIELAGLGAAPYCCMMLADMGAETIRIERNPPPPARHDVQARNRSSVSVDLKTDAGVEILLRLVETADVLVEGFRPGVMERAGIGPDVCLGRNERLVFGRMTGWGQTGPLSASAGHDLDYIALSGALHPIGKQGEKPVPPLNIVGDFNGGLMLAFGIVSALVERQSSGQGQVVDAAMLDAAAVAMSMFQGGAGSSLAAEEPGVGLLAGAAHYYDTYRTKDDKFMAVAAIEPQFYQVLIEKLSLDPERFAPHGFRGLDQPADTAAWAELKQELAAIFRTRTRDEWCEILEGTDACCAPVLKLSEAHAHPHNLARNTFTVVDGHQHPSPAPRFSRSSPGLPAAAVVPGSDTPSILGELGYSQGEIVKLASDGVIPGNGDSTHE